MAMTCRAMHQYARRHRTQALWVSAEQTKSRKSSRPCTPAVLGGQVSQQTLTSHPTAPVLHRHKVPGLGKPVAVLELVGSDPQAKSDEGQVQSHNSQTKRANSNVT